MQERIEHIAGLRSLVVAPAGGGSSSVIFLHGYDMSPEMLAPFAHSIGADATFYFPQGPLLTPNGRFGWWPVDTERRRVALLAGGRDLADEAPAERGALREQMGQYVEATQAAGRPCILGGFSQGAMLSCDFLLRGTSGVAGMFLFSASRIAIAEWRTLPLRPRGFPVLIAHGRADPDLRFEAGVALRDFASVAGGAVTWVPFEGEHAIPFKVWRELRKFIASLAPPVPAREDM